LTSAAGSRAPRHSNGAQVRWLQGAGAAALTDLFTGGTRQSVSNADLGL